MSILRTYETYDIKININKDTIDFLVDDNASKMEWETRLNRVEWYPLASDEELKIYFKDETIKCEKSPYYWMSGADNTIFRELVIGKITKTLTYKSYTCEEAKVTQDKTHRTLVRPADRYILTVTLVDDTQMTVTCEDTQTKEQYQKVLTNADLDILKCLSWPNIFSCFEKQKVEISKVVGNIRINLCLPVSEILVLPLVVASNPDIALREQLKSKFAELQKTHQICLLDFDAMKTDDIQAHYDECLKNIHSPPPMNDTLITVTNTLTPEEKEIEKPLRSLDEAKKEYQTECASIKALMNAFATPKEAFDLLNMEFWRSYFELHKLTFKKEWLAQNIAWEFKIQALLKRLDDIHSDYVKCGICFTNSHCYGSATCLSCKTYISSNWYNILTVEKVNLENVFNLLDNRTLLNVFTTGCGMISLPLKDFKQSYTMSGLVTVGFNRDYLIFANDKGYTMFYIKMTPEEMYKFLCKHAGNTLIW